MFSFFDMYYDYPEASRTDNGYKIVVPAMGYTKEECDLYVENNKLFIKLENKAKGARDWCYILPKDTDVDNIKAKLELGEFVIEISLLKHERKKIAVD